MMRFSALARVVSSDPLTLAAQEYVGIVSGAGVTFTANDEPVDWRGHDFINVMKAFMYALKSGKRPIA